ncbi:MAG: nuclear transport factor 2 family protein [Pseudomonadota bacterium]
MSLTCEDKQSISELLCRAAYAYDERELDMLEACFSESATFTIQIVDADLIGPFEGREAVMTLYRDSLDAQTDVRRHVISNIFFESEGDTPTVYSNLTLFATENGECRLLCTGVYRDTLQRVGDAWLLYRRHLDLDSAY